MTTPPAGDPPHVGDWARHRTKELDDRRVVDVDIHRGVLWLDLAGAPMGPFPIENYDFTRGA